MQTLLFLVDVLFRIKRETRGAIATEYAFLIIFIAIIAAIGMVSLGAGLFDYFDALGSSIGTSAQQQS